MNETPQEQDSLVKSCLKSEKAVHFRGMFGNGWFQGRGDPPTLNQHCLLIAKVFWGCVQSSEL